MYLNSSFLAVLFQEAEAKLRGSGTEFSWVAGSFLRTVSRVGPALVDEQKSGREMFFTAAETTLNQVTTRRFQCF